MLYFIDSVEIVFDVVKRGKTEMVFGHVQRRDAAYMRNRMLRPQLPGGKTLKTKEIYEWSEIGHEVCQCERGGSQGLAWMEADDLLEKGKIKVVKHSAQIKMSVRPTQFICVRLIKGHCSH